MSLHKEIEKLKYDKRLTEWYLSHGKLKPEELKAYLESLPDCSDNVEPLKLVEDGSDRSSDLGSNGGMN